MLSNFCTERTTGATNRKDLWHFSQPCCYVDLYLGLYISATCVLFYIHTFQFIRQWLLCFRWGPCQTRWAASDDTDTLIAIHTLIFVFRPTDKLKRWTKRFDPHFSHSLFSHVLVSPDLLSTRSELPMSIKDKTPWICWLNSKAL